MEAKTKQLRRVEEATVALRQDLATTAAECQAARERLLADIRALTKQVKLKASTWPSERGCKCRGMGTPTQAPAMSCASLLPPVGVMCVAGPAASGNNPTRVPGSHHGTLSLG